MFEMLPVLGRLPSDSFAGIDNDDDGRENNNEEAEIPPSTLGSNGVYRIDKFNINK